MIGGGHLSTCVLLVINSDEVIFIIAKVAKKNKEWNFGFHCLVAFKQGRARIFYPGSSFIFKIGLLNYNGTFTDSVVFAIYFNSMFSFCILIAFRIQKAYLRLSVIKQNVLFRSVIKLFTINSNRATTS